MRVVAVWAVVCLSFLGGVFSSPIPLSSLSGLPGHPNLDSSSAGSLLKPLYVPGVEPAGAIHEGAARGGHRGSSTSGEPKNPASSKTGALDTNDTKAGPSTETIASSESPFVLEKGLGRAITSKASKSGKHGEGKDLKLWRHTLKRIGLSGDELFAVYLPDPIPDELKQACMRADGTEESLRQLCETLGYPPIRKHAGKRSPPENSGGDASERKPPAERRRSSGNSTASNGFSLDRSSWTLRDVKGVRGYRVRLSREVAGRKELVLTEVVPDKQVHQLIELMATWPKDISTNAIVAALIRNGVIPDASEFCNPISFHKFGGEASGKWLSWALGALRVAVSPAEVDLLDSPNPGRIPQESWPATLAEFKKKSTVPGWVSALVEACIPGLQNTDVPHIIPSRILQRNKLLSIVVACDFRLPTFVSVCKAFTCSSGLFTCTRIPGGLNLRHFGFSVNKKEGRIFADLLLATKARVCAEDAAELDNAANALKSRQSTTAVPLCGIDHIRVDPHIPRVRITKKGSKIELHAEKFETHFDLIAINEFLIHTQRTCTDRLLKYDGVLAAVLFIFTQIWPLRTGSVVDMKCWSVLKLLRLPRKVFSLVPLVLVNRKLTRTSQVSGELKAKSKILMQPIPGHLARWLMELVKMRRVRDPQLYVFVDSGGKKITDPRSLVVKFVEKFCEWRELDAAEFIPALGNNLARSIFSTGKTVAEARADTSGIQFDEHTAVLQGWYFLGCGKYVKAVLSRLQVCRNKVATGAGGWWKQMAALNEEKEMMHAKEAFTACFA